MKDCFESLWDESFEFEISLLDVGSQEIKTKREKAVLRVLNSIKIVKNKNAFFPYFLE